MRGLIEFESLRPFLCGKRCFESVSCIRSSFKMNFGFGAIKVRGRDVFKKLATVGFPFVLHICPRFFFQPEVQGLHLRAEEERPFYSFTCTQSDRKTLLCRDRDLSFSWGPNKNKVSCSYTALPKILSEI